MKIAIIHYWWLTNRGGEAVVQAITEVYPHADLYLHVYDADLVKKTLGAQYAGNIFTTFIAKLPGVKKHYQKYLPLMPFALEQLDLTDYDLVFSSEAGPAKGVITRPDALHICYCHSPMRYLWDMYPTYMRTSGRFIKTFFPLIAHWLRMWDRLTADRVDTFFANSTFVAKRIQKFYRRESTVLFPPVNVIAFEHTRQRENFYLCLGQLVPYKRADLVVDVFNQLGLPLVIIGEGELYDALMAKAGKNITLMGKQPFSVVKDHLERCKALVFPGCDDFGIVPVEAMAAGAPVVAYGKGGALDTIVHEKTGILFDEQTIASCSSAVMQIENGNVTFDTAVLRKHAMQFEKAVFKQQFKQLVDAALVESAKS